MGTGTTQAVAMKLGRRFIGADINLGAIQTTTKRLIKVSTELAGKKLNANTKTYSGFEVYNVNHYDIFRNPVQAKDLLLEALEVQRLEVASVFDGEKDGRMVKIMPVNRIATRADLNELHHGLRLQSLGAPAEREPEPAGREDHPRLHGPRAGSRGAAASSPQSPSRSTSRWSTSCATRPICSSSATRRPRSSVKKRELVIERFYPMNLLQKLSLQKEAVEDWRELVESVMIDWNYDGAVLQPAVVDIPDKNELFRAATPCLPMPARSG